MTLHVFKEPFGTYTALLPFLSLGLFSFYVVSSLLLVPQRWKSATAYLSQQLGSLDFHQQSLVYYEQK